jgi:hypothetical protein
MPGGIMPCLNFFVTFFFQVNSSFQLPIVVSNLEEEQCGDKPSFSVWWYSDPDFKSGQVLFSDNPPLVVASIFTYWVNPV